MTNKSIRFSPGRWLLVGLVLLTGLSGAVAEDNSVQRVDVGGRSLAMRVRGEGSPTVLIEAGMGNGPTQNGSWNPIVDAVAKVTRVCLYDRAGLGASDPLPTKTPRPGVDVARDLHRMLDKAGVRGPYVLAGHSIGGLYVRLFANEYPGEVAGVVLVDSTHPDQEARWLAAMPKASENEPAPVTAARNFLAARLSSTNGNPDQLDYPRCAAEVRKAMSLGDMPLVILTHNPKWKMVPDLPDEVLGKMEDATQRFQAGLTNLSTRAKQRIAAKAGHGIPQEDPQLVIDAILETVNEARKSR